MTKLLFNSELLPLIPNGKIEFSKYCNNKEEFEKWYKEQYQKEIVERTISLLKINLNK